jgi:hypothetical protein
MVDDEIETIFSKQTITSTITNKSKDENWIELYPSLSTTASAR